MDASDKVNTALFNGLLADYFPVFKYIPTPGFRKFKNGVDVFGSFSKQSMLDHRQKFDPGGIENIIVSLFHL